LLKGFTLEGVVLIQLATSDNLWPGVMHIM